MILGLKRNVPAPTQARPNRTARFVAANPLLVEVIRLCRKEGDRGLGDTMARLTGGKASKRFTAWLEQIGFPPCGCADAQIWLNEKFPSK